MCLTALIHIYLITVIIIIIIIIIICHFCLSNLVLSPAEISIRGLADPDINIPDCRSVLGLVQKVLKPFISYEKFCKHVFKYFFQPVKGLIQISENHFGTIRFCQLQDVHRPFLVLPGHMLCGPRNLTACHRTIYM